MSAPQQNMVNDQPLQMRIPELDLMRFVAAMAVVMYHYTGRDVSRITGSADTFGALGMVSKFGYLGVEFFFMISGFVILASALNRGVIDFAISRATRLYPAYWTAMIITAVAVFVFDRPEKHISFLQFMANATMLNDYLNIPNIDGVYWTLQAELKFYFCIGLLILTRAIRHYRVWIPVWLAITCSYLLFEQPGFMGWFISPGYSSYFIGGALFFLARKHGMSSYYKIMIVISLLVSMIYAYEHVDGFVTVESAEARWIAPGVVFVFYGVFYLLHIGAIQMKAAPALLIIGGLTYPLYLVHARIGKLIFDNYAGVINPQLLTFLMIFFALMISYFMHRYIEKKISNGLKHNLIAVANMMRSRFSSASRR